MGREMKVSAEADEWNSSAMGVDESRLELAESGQPGADRSESLGEAEKGRVTSR